tara:strand:+ start:82 stop:573 length:492 start_codon:yes stop_codon:yes gene_type:complete
MSKIKSSILLLISLFILNCSSSNNLPKNNYKYSLEYIGGGYDGLVLKKQLTSMLRGFRSFDQNSKKTIKADINHETEIFVTNIDNTSDRERVMTTLQVRVYNKELDCVIFKFNDEISQFYIYASSEKFLSNTKAVESIKYNNTEELVKNFVNDLTKIKSGCLK